MEVEAIVEPFRIHSGSFVPVKLYTILGDPLLPVVDTESSFWPLNITWDVLCFYEARTPTATTTHHNNIWNVNTYASWCSFDWCWGWLCWWDDLRTQPRKTMSNLLTILTGQDHISKVVVFCQVSKSSTLPLIFAKYFIWKIKGATQTHKISLC